MLLQNSSQINTEMEDDSSVTTVESALEFPTGTESELLRIKAAQLWLMVGGETVRVHAGDFAVRVIKQSSSPLSAAICMVGEQQWPLAKDSPVLKVGLNRFCFALPGWLYGLTVPKDEEEGVKRLEEHLQKFSSYEDHSDATESDRLNHGSETEMGFWSTSCLEIEKLGDKLLEKTVTGIQRPAPEIHGETNHEIIKKTQMAIRLSAVTKLVGRTLLRGVVNFHLHVEIEDDSHHTCAFPSIFAFSDVVDAVETAGCSILEVGKELPRSQIPSDFRPWRFNQTGLRLLLRAVATSAMLHASRNSRNAMKEQDGLAGKCILPASEAIGSSLYSGADPCKPYEKPVKQEVSLKFSLGFDSNEE